MKKIIAILVLFLVQKMGHACTVCERNKPKVLQGITHGSNPESNWDYVIVFAIGIVAIFTLIYSIKYLVKHIKYSFLNEQ